MVNFILYFFFLGTLPTIVSSQQQQQQTQCYEGTPRKQGNFWFVCRGGREVPMSCLAPDGRTQFGVGSTYRTENFVLACTQPTPNTIQMEPISCVSKDGHVVTPGNLFAQEDTFFSRCTKNGNSLQMQLVGCVGEHGNLVPNGGSVKKSQFFYRCILTANNIRLEAYGCDYNGQQYMDGQDIFTPAVWYRCQSESNGLGIRIKLMGCYYNNQKYQLDQKFDNGLVLYKCVLDGNQLYPMPIGCIERAPNNSKIEYYPGSRWLSTMPDRNRYLIECQKQGSWIKRVAVQCYYSTPESQGYLNGGCARVVGQTLVECYSPGGPGSPNVVMRITEPYDQNNTPRPLGAGLRFC